MAFTHLANGQNVLYVESDNGLGSPTGDVDDGFAIAALLLKKAPVAALASVFGNTPEPLAFRNLGELARLCGYEGPVWRGATAAAKPSEASLALSAAPQKLTALALGPLTNLTQALNGPNPSLERIVVVGGNSVSRGRLPPVWPFEYNLVKDRPAAARVLQSRVPLTFLPLNVAKRMQVRWEAVAKLEGPVGRHLALHSRRWFRRARWMKASPSVPVWDLAGAALVLWPELFQSEETTAEWVSPGMVQFHRGTRPVRLVTDFSPSEVWTQFAGLFPG